MCSADWKLILEYVKVFLSWPVVVGLVVFIGGTKFRNELSRLIDRISSVEGPGGFKVATTQQEKIEEDKAVESDAAVKPVPTNNDVPQAVQTLQLNEQEQATIRAAFEAERFAARMWEFAYLNYFYAPATQDVLDWLVKLGQATTIDAYDAFWVGRIAHGGEREAVLQALQRHVCIVINGQTIELTPKGREYQAWPDRKRLGFDRRVPV